MSAMLEPTSRDLEDPSGNVTSKLSCLWLSRCRRQSLAGRPASPSDPFPAKHSQCGQRHVLRLRRAFLARDSLSALTCSRLSVCAHLLATLCLRSPARDSRPVTLARLSSRLAPEARVQRSSARVSCSRFLHLQPASRCLPAPSCLGDPCALLLRCPSLFASLN